MADTTDPGSFEDVASLMFEAPPEPVEAETIEAPADEQPEIVEEAEVEETEEAEPETEAVEAEPEVQDAQETVDTTEAIEEPLYSVKVDGEPRDVTLDQLLQGYSGQEYVQKGMKEAASLKNEAQNAYEILQTELRAVQRLRHRMESGDVIAKPDAPSPEMFQNDPLGYMEAKMAHDTKMEAYDADVKRLGNLEQAEQLRMGRAHQAHLAEQMATLQKRIPDFADPEKAPALQNRLVKAGQNFYGFTEQELRGQSDARQIAVLHDAMRYRELKDAGAQVKPAKSKPVIKPGTARTEVTSKSKQRSKAKAQMQRKGDMDSVVNFLLS